MLNPCAWKSVCSKHRLHVSFLSDGLAYSKYDLCNKYRFFHSHCLIAISCNSLTDILLIMPCLVAQKMIMAKLGYSRYLCIQISIFLFLHSVTCSFNSMNNSKVLTLKCLLNNSALLCFNYI